MRVTQSRKRAKRLRLRRLAAAVPICSLAGIDHAPSGLVPFTSQACRCPRLATTHNSQTPASSNPATTMAR